MKGDWNLNISANGWRNRDALEGMPGSYVCYSETFKGGVLMHTSQNKYKGKMGNVLKTGKFGR